MLRSLFTITPALAILLSAGSGCSNSGSGSITHDRDSSPISYPYRIVTTCSMVTDIVANVAGEKGEVTGLMGEGVDPHLFKPTRNVVIQLSDADIVFYSGLMLEGRMADTFTGVGRSGHPVYAVTEEIDKAYLREPPEFAGHWDPHVWMDVAAWKQAMIFVGKALSEFDRPNKGYYTKRAEAYGEQLDQLDNYARGVIATIPERQRVLVTAHDAFGYFGRAYGVEVKSVQGLSTESEAAVKDITDLVDFVIDRKIQAIFIETSVSVKNIEAVIEGVQARDWDVKIGGSLFSDAMGARGTYEGTYIGMIDHNATTIARALGGEAPERGMQGKLSLKE